MNEKCNYYEKAQEDKREFRRQAWKSIFEEASYVHKLHGFRIALLQEKRVGMASNGGLTSDKQVLQPLRHCRHLLFLHLSFTITLVLSESLYVSFLVLK
jgi:hypothetical protein